LARAGDTGDTGILLDTNVLTELMRPAPHAAVLAWFQQKRAPFYTSTITRAEILLGIALLPQGKRSESLAVAADQMFSRDFAHHCLPFDDQAATEYAILVAARHRAGLPISTKMDKSRPSLCTIVCHWPHAMLKTLRKLKDSSCSIRGSDACQSQRRNVVKRRLKTPRRSI
jgi:predicted nucleic acid-binding protein